MKTHNLDTTGWNAYPFNYKGIEFVSLVAPTSPFMARIQFLPAGMFENINAGAVAGFIGDNLTREYIVEKLTEINKDASHAVLELVG